VDRSKTDFETLNKLFEICNETNRGFAKRNLPVVSCKFEVRVESAPSISPSLKDELSPTAQVKTEKHLRYLGKRRNNNNNNNNNNNSSSSSNSDSNDLSQCGTRKSAAKVPTESFSRRRPTMDDFICKSVVKKLHGVTNKHEL
jgi:hypothetical protein